MCAHISAAILLLFGLTGWKLLNLGASAHLESGVQYALIFISVCYLHFSFFWHKKERWLRDVCTAWSKAGLPSLYTNFAALMPFMLLVGVPLSVSAQPKWNKLKALKLSVAEIIVLLHYMLYASVPASVVNLCRRVSYASSTESALVKNQNYRCSSYLNTDTHELIGVGIANIVLALGLAILVFHGAVTQRDVAAFSWIIIASVSFCCINFLLVRPLPDMLRTSTYGIFHGRAFLIFTILAVVTFLATTIALHLLLSDANQLFTLSGFRKTISDFLSVSFFEKVYTHGTVNLDALIPQTLGAIFAAGFTRHAFRTNSFSPTDEELSTIARELVELNLLDHADRALGAMRHRDLRHNSAKAAIDFCRLDVADAATRLARSISIVAPSCGPGLAALILSRHLTADHATDAQRRKVLAIWITSDIPDHTLLSILVMLRRYPDVGFWSLISLASKADTYPLSFAYAQYLINEFRGNSPEEIKPLPGPVNRVLGRILNLYLHLRDFNSRDPEYMADVLYYDTMRRPFDASVRDYEEIAHDAISILQNTERLDEFFVIASMIGTFRVEVERFRSAAYDPHGKFANISQHIDEAARRFTEDRTLKELLELVVLKPADWTV